MNMRTELESFGICLYPENYADKLYLAQMWMDSKESKCSREHLEFRIVEKEDGITVHTVASMSSMQTPNDDKIDDIADYFESLEISPFGFGIEHEH